MKLGFLLFEYFPYGGLQRDCLRTAQACARRGHETFIWTRTWQGERPEGIQVQEFGVHGWSNVARNRNWLREVRAALAAQAFDVLVGFNKMPGLDVYFGADPCYVAKVRQTKPFYYAWLSRYRHYAGLERAVFERGARTRILQLTPYEIPVYRSIYGTEDRFHLLPPMAPRRDMVKAWRKAARVDIRQRRGWAGEELWLLMVGSDFRRKGLDRSLRAMAALPDSLRSRCRLAVLGQSNPGRFARLAGRLGLAGRVHFMGGRPDAPDWMLAADVLVHPAYVETAGAVLVEALTLGLPVLTTSVCGYAFHVENAGAGLIVREPFDQSALDKALAEMLGSEARREAWSARGLDYAAREDLYHCHERATDIIEAIGCGTGSWSGMREQDSST